MDCAGHSGAVGAVLSLGEGGSTATTGSCLPSRAVERSLKLIGAVRDRDRTSVARILTKLSARDLYAIAVTCAAMIPDDQSPCDLLAWNDDAAFIPTPAPANRAPHGTHAAFNRHRTAGQHPCDDCWDGERLYQRVRGRRRRGVSPLAVVSNSRENEGVQDAAPAELATQPGRLPHLVSGGLA